jgi:branched-chain amino acid transport system substrate-binding protein
MADEIRIGALATLVGPYAEPGKDGMRGLDMAVAEFNGQIAGKKLVVIKQGTNAMPEDAEAMAQMLIEQEGVDFIIGPLSGNEGLAIRDFARSYPQKTFINGNAGAQDLAFRDAAPNFFSFCIVGAQYAAGLGEYAFKHKGFKRVATLGEDYSFPYAAIGGFTLEFCRAGGKVVQKFWVPLATQDFSPVIAQLPADIDALYVVLAGEDALNFLRQYDAAGGTKPLLGGPAVVDAAIQSTKSQQHLSSMVRGMIASSSIAENNPAPTWQRFLQRYRELFPNGPTAPSIFAHGYYTNTKAALTALSKIEGDLSDGQQRFQAMLQLTEVQSPTGPVKLDRYRMAIANTFLTMVDQRADGTLYNKLVQIVPNVNQTLGLSDDEFRKLGPFNRDNPPACP